MLGLKKKLSAKSEMENLLNDKSAPKLPKVGEVAKGNVMEIGSNIIYVDLGPVGTGAIYGCGKFEGLSMFNDLKLGDSISATVVDLENEDGYVEMSLKETSFEMVWKELEKKMEEGEIITTKILEANKGGLMVKIIGIIGFLPASQLSSDYYPRVSDGDKNKILSLLMQTVGKDMKVKIIGIDKEEGKLILSEKATKKEKEKERISSLQIGDEIDGEISGIVNFGVFVKFGENLEGLVHISELAWKLIDDPRKFFNVGQKVGCKIIGIDDDRISLSIKALEKDPWEKIDGKYKIKQKVKGEVTKINPFGAFIQLDKDIHGLAHVSKLDDGSGVKDMEIGKVYEFEIISIESSEHRLGLKPYVKKKTVEKDEKEDTGKKDTKDTKKKSVKKAEKTDKKENVKKKEDEKKDEKVKKTSKKKDDSGKSK
ncbi:30S ribosomal protein S1 [Candidatus Parcubacteria bacterium]|nr:30S ribosomal protein S1 [Candidatus Parcubacteria bacterium]